MRETLATWKRTSDAFWSRALRAIDGAPLWTALAIAAAHAGVRLWGLARPGLWGDEAINVWWTREPLRAAIADSLSTLDPPLFNLLLHGWTRLFGVGEAAVRALPAALAVATAVELFVLARAWFGARAALFASLALLVSGSLQAYAHETRPTTLACALVVASLLALEAVARRPGARAVLALALVDAALVYTHYLTALFLVAQLGVVLVMPRAPGTLKRFAFGQLLAAALVAPLAFEVLRRHLGPPGWQRVPTSHWILAALDELAGGLAPLYVALALAALSTVVVRRAAEARRRRAALWLWLAAPFALMLAVSWFAPMFHPRYVLYSAPALALLAGEAIAALPLGESAQLALVAVTLAAGARGFEPSPPKEHDWQLVASRLKRDCASDCAIVVHPRWHLAVLAYYFDRAAFLDRDHTEARLNAERVWVVRSAELPSADELGRPKTILLVQFELERLRGAADGRAALAPDYAMTGDELLGGARLSTFNRR
ncbi:MAG TPA: glycosyltransferase family 39 protein [Polyangia bacterium]|nr:glycosyltransferase family 39 protein [Polyangia bacterium]